MDFRVTVSYPVSDPPPDPGELEQLCHRLEAARPDAAARVAPSMTTLDVALTVQAGRQVEAIADAVSVADAVVGDASIRATAQPAPHPDVAEP